VLHIKPHGFDDAVFGFLEGLSQTVDAGEIVAIGVILLALFLNRDGVAVEGHRLMLADRACGYNRRARN
jgi:hypothetical protein